MTAATPGQAALLAYERALGGQTGSWKYLGPAGRAAWEAAAQAGIDAFLAGDSVSAGAIREALAAREPHAADELAAGERDLLMSDIGDLLDATGLGDHARAETPHEVFRQCIDAVRQLAADLREAQHAARTHRERLRMLLGDTPFEFKPDWAPEYEDETGDIRELPEPQPAPELAAAMAESRRYREALQQVAKHIDSEMTPAHARTFVRIAKRALEGK